MKTPDFKKKVQELANELYDCVDCNGYFKLLEDELRKAWIKGKNSVKQKKKNK